MWAAILTLAPLLLELIKLFFGAPSDKRADVIKDVKASFAKIRDAIQKAQDTEGDTSAIEDLINGKK